MNRRGALKSLAAGALAPLGMSVDRVFPQTGATSREGETPLHYLSLQDVARRIASRVGIMVGYM